MTLITPSCCGLLDVPAEILHELCASPREYYALIRTCKHLWHAYTQHRDVLAGVIAKHFPHAQQLEPSLSHSQRYKALCFSNQNLMHDVYTSLTLEGDSVVAFPDGRLATLNYMHIDIWSREGKRTALLDNDGSYPRIETFVACPDGRLIGTCCDAKHARGTMMVWNKENKWIATFQGHTEKITDFAVYPNGDFVSSSVQEKTIKIWSKENKCIATLQGFVARDLAPLSNGQLAFLLGSESPASLLGNYEKTIKIWNVKTGECTTFLTEKMHSFVPCPNGQLASDCNEDRTIKIWDIEKRKCTAIFQDIMPSRLTTYPNGQLACSSNGTIRILNIERGECIATLQGIGIKGSHLTAFPDGRLAVLDSLDQISRYPIVKIRNCGDTHNNVFAEIAEQLLSANYANVLGEDIAIKAEAMARFSRMPKYARELIYLELAKLLNFSSLGQDQDPIIWGENAFLDLAGQTSTSQQKVDAIRAYLANQSIHRSVIQRITDFFLTCFRTAFDWARYGVHCLTCWRFAPVDTIPNPLPTAAAST